MPRPPKQPPKTTKPRAPRPIEGATEHRLRIVCDALSKGCTYAAAAAAAGLPRSTVARWLSLGRAGRPRYAEIAARLERASDKFEAKAVDYVHTFAAKDWHAAAWLLERRKPAEYGRGQDRLAAQIAAERANRGLSAEDLLEALLAAGLSQRTMASIVAEMEEKESKHSGDGGEP